MSSYYFEQLDSIALNHGQGIKLDQACIIKQMKRAY